MPKHFVNTFHSECGLNSSQFHPLSPVFSMPRSLLASTSQSLKICKSLKKNQNKQYWKHPSSSLPYTCPHGHHPPFGKSETPIPCPFKTLLPFSWAKGYFSPLGIPQLQRFFMVSSWGVFSPVAVHKLLRNRDVLLLLFFSSVFLCLSLCLRLRRHSMC